MTLDISTVLRIQMNRMRVKRQRRKSKQQLRIRHNRMCEIGLMLRLEHLTPSLDRLDCSFLLRSCTHEDDIPRLDDRTRTKVSILVPPQPLPHAVVQRVFSLRVRLRRAELLRLVLCGASDPSLHAHEELLLACVAFDRHGANELGADAASGVESKRVRVVVEYVTAGPHAAHEGIARALVGVRAVGEHI